MLTYIFQDTVWPQCR